VQAKLAQVQDKSLAFAAAAREIVWAWTGMFLDAAMANGSKKFSGAARVQIPRKHFGHGDRRRGYKIRTSQATEKNRC
jgi:hypothetical protein